MSNKFTSDQWQALSPRLDEALEMAEEERAIWLTALRAQDPSLARQLEVLLEEHRLLSAEGFLDERPMEIHSSPGLAGQKLGVYTLISQIGHGGMGTVWLAERNDGRFERRVAVKILNYALVGKTGEERFQREGRILGRLTHPHIAELIDAGVSPGGQPFLVLEYVEGEHIDRYCDQNRLDVRARVRLFLGALHGVAEAHAHLIVHRDLKPSNILVGTDGKAKLLDFGIAKLLGADGHIAEPALTLEGGRALTPQYAAPEQLKGEAVTPVTDVYAAGVLLYELLTGQHPAGTGPHTPASLVRAILETEPPSLSDAVTQAAVDLVPSATNASRRFTSPGKLARWLRGDLDTIVAKALKKNPQERYSSIIALAEDLQRYLNYEPISARPDAIFYRFGKFVRRHRTSVAASLVVTLALIFATVAWFFPRRAEPLPQFHQKKLTANAQDSPVHNVAISPDGKYVGYADKEGIHLQLTATGTTPGIALPPDHNSAKASWAFGNWFPDSARFLASVTVPGAPSSIWAISVTDGKPSQKLAEVDDIYDGGTVSPDGLKVAYERLRSSIGAREIWIMGSNGESPHKIFTAENRAIISGIGWSPTGNRLAFRYSRDISGRAEIMVQSCDLDGADERTILQDNRLSAFAWLTSGRFVYSRNSEVGAAESDNLWELKVDRKSGNSQGKPHQLTDWSGFSVSSFSATADGKQLVFVRGTDHASVFVGDLADKENRLVNSRLLTLDDYYNLPMTWTPDSNEVIYSSQRASNWMMFRQPLDLGSAAQPITPAGDTNFVLARLSPDGTWVLLEGRSIATRKIAIYRVRPTGGAPQLVFNTQGFVQFWCTNKSANFCVFGQISKEKNELVIMSFDPLAGPGKELVRIPLEKGASGDVGYDYVWQLSPDGSQIGIVKRHGNQIRLVPLGEGQTRMVTMKNYPDLMDLNWATNSQSMFVSTLEPAGASVLHVDLKGEAQPIWHQAQSVFTWGFPSPDGRHLALLGSNSESNVWMIDNF